MSMKKRIMAGLLTAVMAVTALAGCNSGTSSSSSASGSESTTGGSSASTSAAGSSAAGTETQPASTVSGPKEIVVNLGSEPPEMNSILTTSTGSMNVLRHIMDGLVMLDQQDNPVPAIAESWDVSDDNLTYTFHLRKDAKWTNGDPVTANDFIFAWNTFFTPATAAEYAATWSVLIEGAEAALNSADDAALQTALENIGYKALDEYTIEVKLTNPYPYFLSVLAFPSFFPMNEKAYTEFGADAYGTEAEYFCTNGAFKVTGWEHENEFVVEKYADYYGASEIKLDKITFTMISDSNTRMNSFQAGDLDMIALTGDQPAQVEAEGKTYQSYDDGSCWYFEFQTTQKGLNNPKVRKALTLGIDAEAFIKNVIKNSSAVSYSFVPTAINNGEYATAVGKVLNRVENGDYSQIKALLEEGLAEEGMTTADLKIAIITDEGDNAAKNCAFFQEQWKTNLGVEATVEQMPYKARLDRMSNKDFSVVLAGWGPDYNDPMTFMDLFVTGGGNNHTSWSSPEYDKLIEDAIKEPDAAKRREILITAEKMLLDEMPIGPIYNRKQDYICSDRLTGVVRTAFDDMNFRWADVIA